MRSRVEKALESVRSALMSHGGNVELAGILGKTVLVKLTGACGGCPHAQMTLRSVVEEAIRREVPEVEKVEAV